MANSKLPISSSSVPKPTTSSSTTTTPPLPQPLINDINTALLSANAIPRIQSLLHHSLASSGWTANLRTFVLQLLRSGECGSYDEVMARVLAEIGGDGDGEREEDETKAKAKANGVNGVNGEGKVGRTVEDGGMRVPEAVVREGIKAVRKELEGVCDVVLDG